MRRLLFLIMVLFPVSNAGYARSLSVADSCLHILNTRPGLSSQERCELLLGTIHNLDYNDSFISLCNLLIKEAAKNESYYHLFYGYYEKGQYLILFEGKTQDGLALIFKSLDIAKANLLTLEEGLAYYRISGEYSQLNNKPRALDYLSKAIDIFSKTDNSLYLAIAKLEFANIHYELKDYEKALVLYMETEKFFATSNNLQPLAYIYGNIGTIQSKKKSPDSARQNLLHAISILEEINDPQAIITYHLELSQNELLCSDHGLALRYAQKAFQTAEAINNPRRKQDTFEQLMKVFAAMGDYQQAYDYQNKYLHLRDSLLNMETITQMANMRADFEISQKQQEVEQLAASKRKITLISLITLLSLIVVAFLLLRVYRDARRKKTLNKELLLKQEALSRSKKELERVNDSKDRLFSIIAHDLRSPMATLSGLSLIVSQLLESKQIKEAEELNLSIYDTIGQIDFMLDNLLHWSINQQDIYHPLIGQFDLPELSCKILKAYYQTALAKDITLTFESDPSSLMVESDSNSWGIIIRNLVNNALKFTHPGGRVEVRLRAGEESVVLEVADNGVGMSPGQLDKLFTNFNSQSSWGTCNEKGQGLGLSLIHEFVTRGKGQITVSSELNKGTKFTVCIPLLILQSRAVSSEQSSVNSEQ